MICIIQMDRGTPNIDPKPIGWVMAIDFDEAIRCAEQVGDTEVAVWLEKHRFASKGRFDLPEKFGAGRRFALIS